MNARRRLDEAAAWCVEVADHRPERERVDETLLTVADGRFGTRSSLEEGGPGAEPLVLAAGVYDDRDPLVTLLPGPVWTGLDMPSGAPVGGRRVLDLRTGVVAREADLPAGGLRTERFAASARPGVAVLRAQAPAGAVRPGPALQPPADDTGYAAGWAGECRWARTTSRLGGGIAMQRTVPAGPVDVIERIVALQADPHRPPPVGPLVEAAAGLMARGYDALLAEQRTDWARRWAHVAVAVEGDPIVELGARFALFHLLTSAAGSEAALGARGLSGRGYAGHVFWDTDVYALPVLAATKPQAARALLEYRLRRLPAARRRAAARGLDGARFPWESAHDGSEVTPATARHPSGAIVPILTRHHAEHIVADVAWGAWQYALWSGDEAFLGGPGEELLSATAAYWASRIRYDRHGRGHLQAVVGPDEYHGPVDDNAYTNVMARWNLRRAAEVIERSTTRDGRHTATRWRSAAAALVDGYDAASRRYEQFAGYFGLEPLLIEELAAVPVAADLLLGVERTAASQVIKQADVLMLHHLVPEETAAGSLVPDLDFYAPRTAHGSSLSPAIHAAVLARAGRPDDALRLLRLACRLDLDDLTGTTAGGLHIATLAGVWQALVYGFAGLRPQRGVLDVAPVLPKAWSALEVRVVFHGTPVTVRLDHDAVRVTAEAPGRVRVRYGGVVHTVGRAGCRFARMPKGASA
jgi:trehalose/maltose hydrolase-like predicted phosphorylase